MAAPGGLLIVGGKRIEVRGRAAAIMALLAHEQQAINEPYFGSVVVDFRDEKLVTKITRGIRDTKIEELLDPAK